jgi:hypothetical protein
MHLLNEFRMAHWELFFQLLRNIIVKFNTSFFVRKKLFTTLHIVPISLTLSSFVEWKLHSIGLSFYAPFELIEFYVKSVKHGTVSQNLVQNGLRLKIHVKKYIRIIQSVYWGMHDFFCQTEFHPILIHLSFFLSASTGATYIFTTPTCTTTMVTSNCALTAEFQDFNKTSLLCRPHSKSQRGDKEWKESQRQGEDMMTLRSPKHCITTVLNPYMLQEYV